MAYRNGNYTAFYVSEPFNESNLEAYSTKDFVYYNLLRAWKENDKVFPFIDSHEKTYNVRDNMDLSQDSGHKKIKFFSAQQPFMECSTS